MDVSIFWHLSRALMTSMMCSQVSAYSHVSGLRQEAVGLYIREGSEDACLLADTCSERFERRWCNTPWSYPYTSSC